jgi:outer membrane scaffolding protein for murein synthesis (MipA/OmpV family)
MNKPSLFLLPLLLAVAGTAAAADNTATLMMPDGSSDMYVGAAIATRTAAGDGERRATALRPLFQIQWSNGIFASATGVVGMHLSGTPGVEYGPLLLDSNARNPRDSRRFAGTHEIDGTPDAGGFYNYFLGTNTHLLVNAVYDSSAHGLRGQFGVQKRLSSLAPHHTVSVSASVALASSPVMREWYEVSAAAGGKRDYRPSGGVASLNAGANWNWALSSKWLVSSSVTATRLGGAAADSPVVERRNFITWSSGLAYRF